MNIEIHKKDVAQIANKIKEGGGGVTFPTWKSHSRKSA